METRRFGRSGPRVGVVGVCPGASPQREAIVLRARELGCTLIGGDLPPEGGALVRYNLLDQKPANEEISRQVRAGQGIVAIHVLAGGALGGKSGHSYGGRIEALKCLVKPGRSLVQAAIQFVLANESVSAAMIGVSTVAHLEEAAAAPDAAPLTGQDLEQIFELWANRFE